MTFLSILILLALSIWLIWEACQPEKTCLKCGKTFSQTETINMGAYKVLSGHICKDCFRIINEYTLFEKVKM